MALRPEWWLNFPGRAALVNRNDGSIRAGLCTDELLESELDRFDIHILNLVQNFICPRLTSVMKMVSYLGSFEVLSLVLALSLIILFSKKKYAEGITLITAIAGSYLLTELLKHTFHRERPDLNILISQTGYSYPSGHSMVSFACYGMLVYLFFSLTNSKLLRFFVLIFFSIIVGSIGISRIYLGVHYPSDVISGYSAGGVWLIICLMGLRLIKNKMEL